MVNCFDFEGADELQPRAERATRAILRLRQKMDAAGLPVIYVNDNFGEWHSEKSLLVERAMSRSNPVTSLVIPREHDYFVIKPQFSGFYSTNLSVLLPKLGVSRLILTGILTDVCILFTAADAHMRDYDLWIPTNAVASVTDERNGGALRIIQEAMKAETASTDELALEKWLTH